ncbi:hypothetical protein V1517DRAFT_33796 [Lipomyces orientalis]|uniref:Uncharacterized protein n=1 Tax=Lipomyces orientalis TaxID=1233043 RepID=A0ACC3TF80_9ASCO
MQQRRRGRPIICAPIAYVSVNAQDKRREQIRIAGRTYREKRAKTVIKLQMRLRTLEVSFKQLITKFVEICDHVSQLAAQHDDSNILDVLDDASRHVLKSAMDAVYSNDEYADGESNATQIESVVQGEYFYPGIQGRTPYQTADFNTTFVSPYSVVSASNVVMNSLGSNQPYGPKLSSEPDMPWSTKYIDWPHFLLTSHRWIIRRGWVKLMTILVSLGSSHPGLLQIGSNGPNAGRMA